MPSLGDTMLSHHTLHCEELTCTCSRDLGRHSRMCVTQGWHCCSEQLLAVLSKALRDMCNACGLHCDRGSTSWE